MPASLSIIVAMVNKNKNGKVRMRETQSSHLNNKSNTLSDGSLEDPISLVNR